MDREIRLLFHELLDLSPAERERIFEERGIGENVRSEVASLLSFDSAGSDLTGCVSEAAGGMLAAGEPAVCGPYRLLRMLGSGGMGTVYLAERSDGEIQRQVAIKLLGAGGCRPEWRDRFLRERQLLASLNHASIVHLLDAGHTQDGRPYLVMEYVEGIPIDTYAAGIEVRARLELFLRVCDGVSHAHQRLIVHRDLKPSNILVDASGQPKLLDFGIAKLLDESGDATQTVECLLTPGYASPEQLSGMAQTTATDVYSLGAVLYKTLTGRPPHETEGGTARTLDVITGAHEIPAPTRLNPTLPGDLDYVLRKALRTEPDARYASVDAFAADLRAVLERRPVAARAGDAWYRARRFLRRYWVPIAAAAATVTALSVGLYATNRERAIAQRRFVEVRQLANRLFDIDVAVRSADGVTKARELIVATSLEYLRRLSAEVHGDPALALDLGTAYLRVARVQGVPIAPDLGQTEEAERSLRAAGKLIEGVLAAQPANRTAFLRMSQIYHDRMILAGIRGSEEEATHLARVSQTWLERYLGSGKVDLSDGAQVAIVINNIANRYRRSGLFDEAARLCHRGVAIARAVNQPRQAGAMFLTTAAIYRDQGELDRALTDIREGAKELKPTPGEASVGRVFTYALALIREGEILGQDDGISMGRFAEAQVPLQQAYELLEGIVHKDPANSSSRTRLATAGVDLGDLLRHTDPKRAVAVFDETLLHLSEVKNNVDARRNEIDALTDSTYPLRRLGRIAEARRRLQAAFARLRQIHLYPAERIELGGRADLALRARADLEAGTGNVAGASGIYDELLRQVLAGGAKPETDLADAVDLSNLYRAAAEVQRRAGRRELAASLAARRAELWRQWSARLPQNSFVRRQLGAALLSASTFSANSLPQSRFPN